MSTRLRSMDTLLTLSMLVVLSGCSSKSSSDPKEDGGATNTDSGVGGALAAGGKLIGGASSIRGGSGGTVTVTQAGANSTRATTTGNAGATHATIATGGFSSAGSSAVSTGGVSIGGSLVNSAGSTAQANGGVPSGGATTVGSAGNALAGAATGGVALAGAAGKATGGAATGGTATGGTATGGAATGGAATGGAATGGAATGGTATGGAATGGTATGGTATGGTATGGTTSIAVAGSAGVAGSPYPGPPSCDGTVQCGSPAESCCTPIEVPGGKYLRGRGSETCPDCQTGCPAAVHSDSGCNPDEVPEKEVTISSFKLDKYLVTVGRMKKFVAAFDAWRQAGNPKMYDGAIPSNQDTGFRTGWSLNVTSNGLKTALACETGKISNYNTGSDDDPVNCVNWLQAFAFCIWDGGRLPTEAEWEYAAAGGAENRLYPWGSAAPDNTRAYFGGTDPRQAVGAFTAGAARWGHLDMAGLLWEWTLDIYDASYYSDPSTCIDCSNWNFSSGSRVLRGGGYSNTIGNGAMRATRRLSGTATPTYASNAWGFRCARNL